MRICPIALQRRCPRYRYFVILLLLMAAALCASFLVYLSTFSNQGSVSLPQRNEEKQSWSPNSKWPPIPRIIHQTYENEMINQEYWKFISECLRLNPGWDYFLWRDVDAEELIKDHYPWLMPRYRKLEMKVERSDFARYVALHHYGGVYLDMDIECVQPLMPALETVGPAFLDQERMEQARICYGHEGTAMNSAMGAAAGHPFILALLAAINSAPANTDAPLWTTGPMMLTRVYRSWTAKADPTRYPVKLLEPQVFSPIMDGTRIDYNPRYCDKLPKASADESEKTRWQKLGCAMLNSANWKADDTNNATVGKHRFKHLGWKPNDPKAARFDIRKLRSDAKMYQLHKMRPRG